MTLAFRHVLLLLLALTLLCGCGGATSDAELVQGNISMHILPDPGDSLSVNQVLEMRSEAQPFEKDIFDDDTPTYWMIVESDGDGFDRAEAYLKIIFIDTVEIFYPKDAMMSDYAISGDDIPFPEKQVAYGEGNLVRIPLAQETRTTLIRMKSGGQFSKAFRERNDFEILSSAEFEFAAAESRYFHGTFLGVALAMIFFNLLIFLLFRERTYGVYVAFLILQTMYHLAVTGFLNEYLYRDYPVLAKLAPFYIAAIALIFYTYFSQLYLESKRFAPMLHRWLNYVYWAVPLICIYVFFNIKVANFFLFGAGLGSSTIALIIAYIAFRRKSRPAIYYIISTILGVATFYVFMAMRMEFIPTMFMTKYSYQLSFSLQVLLFTTGLADRILLTRKALADEKLAQEQLKRQKELELKEVLERQNQELEVKVKERTLELEMKNLMVLEEREIIKKERQKSDKLLLNILPSSIADRLKSGEEMIADRYESVTVFFSDLVGFTDMSRGVSPDELVSILNEIFTRMDRLAKAHGLEKIKTIGDAYMCVGGLPEPQSDHAQRVADFALDVIKEMKAMQAEGERSMELRIGVHSGSVVAGVIGQQKFAYDLWGETVNMASRMESGGIPMQVQCSAAFRELLMEEYEFESRGRVNLKGIGEVDTYFLLGRS